MKQIYLFTVIFILAITFKSHSQQIVASWTGTNTGTLSGVPFVFTNSATRASGADLSGVGFEYAPITGNTTVFAIRADSNWTVTFDSPIPNLRLYCRYLRSSAVSFDQPFTILEGSVNLSTHNGTQLNSVLWGNGIIEFTNPITTLTITYLAGDTNEVQYTFGLAETLTLSIDEVTINNTIDLYPNPAKDTFKLSGLFKTENFSIYNTLGSLVKKGNISANDEINIQNLTKGMYFLKLEDGNTYKFMKE